MLRKLVKVFIVAFILNLIWEYLHANLYIHYRGGEITNFILFRASFLDAFMIAIVGWLTWKQKMYIPIVILFILAVVLEKYALASGRWAYNDFMPILPVIKTGLTPTIQLGLLAFLTFRFTGFKK